MAVDPARELAALHEPPRIALDKLLGAAQRIRRAARFAICLPAEQWAIGNPDAVLQFLGRIQRVRISAARLGQEQHAAGLEGVLEELEALLAEGPQHTRVLQALLDASLMPILQVSHGRVTSQIKRAAELTAQAATSSRWAVVEATSAAVLVAGACSAVIESQEGPLFANDAPSSTAGVRCATGAAVGIWALSNSVSKRLAGAREAAGRLQAGAALVTMAQASLVEDWMELEGALLVAFAQEVQGGLLALQGELLRGRLDNVHAPCMHLGRSVSALQHTLALLTGPV